VPARECAVESKSGSRCNQSCLAHCTKTTKRQICTGIGTPHPQHLHLIGHILERQQRTIMSPCSTSFPQLCTGVTRLLDGFSQIPASWYCPWCSHSALVPRLLAPAEWLTFAVPSDPSDPGWSSTDYGGARAFQCLFLPLLAPTSGRTGQDTSGKLEHRSREVSSLPRDISSYKQIPPRLSARHRQICNAKSCSCRPLCRMLAG
jgi:hypothetical protein